MEPSRPMSFEGSDGRAVRGDHHPAADRAAPWVVICHGFKGFKDWGFFPTLAERIQQAGLHALRINFSHNGVIEADFDDLDSFREDTWTRHQEDLKAVLNNLGTDLIGLVGHSRGGADAIIKAAADARIRAVCALAPVADTTRLPEDWESTIAEHGFYPVPNQRTGQVMPVGPAFFEDSMNYDVVACASQMSGRPLLCIHGDQDEAVPASDSRALVEAHGNAALEIIEGTGHTFGGKHPMEEIPESLDRTLTIASEWLEKKLR